MIDKESLMNYLIDKVKYYDGRDLATRRQYYTCYSELSDFVDEIIEELNKGKFDISTPHKEKCKWELIPNGDCEYYETECNVDIPYVDEHFKFCYNCGKAIEFLEVTEK